MKINDVYEDVYNSEVKINITNIFTYLGVNYVGYEYSYNSQLGTGTLTLETFNICYKPVTQLYAILC